MGQSSLDVIASLALKAELALKSEPECCWGWGVATVVIVVADVWEGGGSKMMIMMY